MVKNPFYPLFFFFRQGLKRGEITTQHLYQQLANPALQPRHREMLVTILKIQGGGTGYGPSPRVLSPVPPHHMFQQQQQQQLRVSPLPPNGECQLVRSCFELGCAYFFALPFSFRSNISSAVFEIRSVFFLCRLVCFCRFCTLSAFALCFACTFFFS